jgi:uncharacterized protein
MEEHAHPAQGTQRAGSGARKDARSAKPSEGEGMGFDQYHEPPEELSAETRTFARIITSLTEEAEAISWYQQRIAIEPDPEARAIMENAQS